MLISLTPQRASDMPVWVFWASFLPPVSCPLLSVLPCYRPRRLVVFLFAIFIFSVTHARVKIYTQSDPKCRGKMPKRTMVTRERRNVPVESEGIKEGCLGGEDCVRNCHGM